MKKILQINCLAVLMMAVFFVKSYGQQKPSERSFTAVVNQIKQKQTTQSKVLQHIKQVTPTTTASTSENIQTQQPGTTTSATITHQNLQPGGTNGQPINSKLVKQRPRY